MQCEVEEIYVTFFAQSTCVSRNIILLKAWIAYLWYDLEIQLSYSTFCIGMFLNCVARRRSSETTDLVSTSFFFRKDSIASVTCLENHSHKLS